jgi:two-component system chemotaxis response regulator CheB
MRRRVIAGPNRSRPVAAIAAAAPASVPQPVPEASGTPVPPSPDPRRAAVTVSVARPPATLPGRPPLAVAIGASTGGPQALAALVRHLPPAPPVPLVIVQHMPAGFTAMLADHLGRLGGPPAAEARDGEALRAGRLYLASGDRHLLVEAAAEGTLVARLSDAPAENFCRPAVDPLLRSLVAACGPRLLAVILTGMGQDGLLGCRAVVAAGGQVLAQDEASSVVWGMPGAVARAGLAAAVLPPEGLASRIAAALAAPGATAPGVAARTAGSDGR